KNSMEPHLYRFMPYGRGPRGKFAMKIAPEETNRTINRIKDRYMSMFPGNPFEYFFLDDYFNQQYRADELFGKVIGLFAFLAIFVTGLGIFGMSSYMAVQRTREIGIRKTLGATTGLIFRMMFKDFLVLIGISVVVAWPLTFLAIQKWLNSFAYRMPISALLFLLPLVLILIITSGAVSSNILKVANTNPVDALKYE
ncbi:MAG: ABC transporter permease, partial [Candidatus Aminicenantes bacterium]|nr:ABC transporter permease [Candidatus Aminicenantes bacterium]